MNLLRRFPSNAFAAFHFALVLMLLLSLSSPLPADAQDEGQNKQTGEEKSSEKSKEDEKKPDRPDQSKIKELEKLDITPPQKDEALRGLPKQIPGDFRPGDPLLREIPTAQDKLIFRSARSVGNAQGPADKDLKVIEKVVKDQVYTLADTQDPDDLSKARYAIEKVLDEPRQVNPQFLAIYKRLLLKYLPDLMTQSITVKYNGMILLGKLRDEATLPLFLEYLKDPKQHEVVKLASIKGITYLGEIGVRSVDLESQAIDTLLSLSRAKNLHPWTRWSIVQALGALKQARNSPLADDALVSKRLIEFLRDPQILRLHRVDGVKALSNLDVPGDFSYNFQLPAHEIALFAVETSKAAITAAERNAVVDDLLTGLFLYECYSALQEIADQAKDNPDARQNADPLYATELQDRLKKMVQSALAVFKPTGNPRSRESFDDKVARITSNLPKSPLVRLTEQLEEYLKENPPRSMKLTSIMEDLPPHPFLIKGTSTEKDAAEEKETQTTTVGP